MKIEFNVYMRNIARLTKKTEYIGKFDRTNSTYNPFTIILIVYDIHDIFKINLSMTYLFRN